MYCRKKNWVKTNINTRTIATTTATSLTSLLHPDDFSPDVPSSAPSSLMMTNFGSSSVLSSPPTA